MMVASSPVMAPPRNQAQTWAERTQSPAMREILQQIEEEIPRLRRFARSLTRDPDHADDLVQECLMRAIAKIDTWQPGTNLRAWLFTILRNAFLNDVRRSDRSPFTGDEIDPDRHGAIEASQESHIAVDEIATVFAGLSAEHRVILTLVAIEGFAYEEAATICDIPVGTVRSRLSRAREAMRQALQGTGLLSDASD